MTAAPALTVEQLDPATLLIDANIRTTTNSDKALVASIREVGVLMPIVAVRTAEGDVRVRHGHRRTLAALEADRPTVPVIVTGDDDADDVARIVTQWHENEHRAGLSTADKLAAAEQLALLGLSAAQIAKRTHARKADIDQALAASGSALAKGATQRWEFLTLAQAAAVAEFDTEPDTVKALVAAAKDGEYDFEHVLQRARDERAEAAQVAEITEQLTTAGVRIIDRPSYADRAVKLLTDLTTPGGKAINPERHTRCPGHAAYIQRGYREARAVSLCTDPKTNGHRDRYSTTSAAPVTGEQASTERREVIANNKAWRSAEAVRRRWITDFLTRKTPPKGAAGYLAGELARGGHEIRRAMETGQPLAATLLGVTGPTRDSVPALVAGASDARAQVITLAVVLAAVEASTSEALWRHSTDTVRRYLAFLTANGYPLSDVEQLAAKPATA